MNFDQLFYRATKVIGLMLGTAIFTYETVADHVDRPYLFAAALLMMGLQIGEAVEKIATGFGTRTAPLQERAEKLERK